MLIGGQKGRQSHSSSYNFNSLASGCSSSEVRHAARCVATTISATTSAGPIGQFARDDDDDHNNDQERQKAEERSSLVAAGGRRNVGRSHARWLGSRRFQNFCRRHRYVARWCRTANDRGVSTVLLDRLFARLLASLTPELVGKSMINVEISGCSEPVCCMLQV